MIRFIPLLLAVLVLSFGVNGEAESINSGDPVFRKREAGSLQAKRDDISLRSKKSVSQADKDVILEAHNNFRKSENAANIKKMEWNTNLEETAQGWADQCKWYHGQPATPASVFEYPGQNIYAKSPFETNINYTYIVWKWFDEKQYYGYESGSCSRVCGHYTQVVWHETTDVGCGFARCPTVERLDWKDVLVVVCNYGPGGNWKGEKPYDKGTPCSACPNRCEEGLCVD